MNRIFYTLRHRLYPLVKNWNGYFINKSFLLEDKIINNEMELKPIYNHSQICNKLNIKDERWNQIRYIGAIMKNDMYKKFPFLKEKFLFNLNNELSCDKVIFENEEIKCKSSGFLNDWVFLKNNCKINAPYVFEFEAKILFENSEFQFAFFYKNIGSRYRFNLKKNKLLSFEVVENGCFHNDIISKPLSLKIGEWTKFKITITNNYFIYNVDDEDKMIVKNNSLKKNEDNSSFALILWDSNISNINTSYRNLYIHYLKQS